MVSAEGRGIASGKNLIWCVKIRDCLFVLLSGTLRSVIEKGFHIVAVFCLTGYKGKLRIGAVKYNVVAIFGFGGGGNGTDILCNRNGASRNVNRLISNLTESSEGCI